MLLKLKLVLSNSYVVQKYKRSARNIMVIARMPEDRSATFEHIQTHPSKPYTPRAGELYLGARHLSPGTGG
eukprot:3480673-Heterocapsa_arctica.AAC.1